ncbi:hypothetical protein D3C72_2094630 [compost metagenome]
MAQRDGTAVHVQAVHRDAQLFLAVQRLRGEGLVQFPEVDVLHLQAVARQQLGDGVDRADAHLVRLAAGDGQAAERAQRTAAGALGLGRLHQHAGRRAIG